MDLEHSSIRTVSNRNMEHDWTYLDDIIVLQDGSFDLPSIDMGVHTLVEALENSILAILRNPAMSAGDLRKGNSKVTGKVTANGHFLMMHGKDPLVVSFSLHDQLQWQHVYPSVSRIDWTEIANGRHLNV